MVRFDLYLRFGCQIATKTVRIEKGEFLFQFIHNLRIQKLRIPNIEIQFVTKMSIIVCSANTPIDQWNFSSQGNDSALWNGTTTQISQSTQAEGLADLRTLIAGTAVFIVTFPFVVLHIKWVPLGATGAVLVGSLLMVLTGVLTQEEVYEILGTFPSSTFNLPCMHFHFFENAHNFHIPLFVVSILLI